jgi:hypothetical protein
MVLEGAKFAGAPLGEIARLEEQLLQLKGEGHRQQREALHLNSYSLPRHHPRVASKENIRTIYSALTKSEHWAAPETRANLLQIVEGNDRIPDRYREQLHHDVAKVLEVCPHAGGLVRQLTLRGQRGATGSMSKLGSKSNAALGAAYELMGTATLATKVVQPVNPGAPALHINRETDVVTFGDKAYLNRRSGDGKKWSSPTRSTIECDIRIGRPATLFSGQKETFLEIGIDFKHVKEMKTKYATADFRNQVENVAWAIKEGQIHEYHFVTNGKFSDGFRDVVNKANTELTARGETPIGLYEYVSTLGIADPLLK